MKEIPEEKVCFFKEEDNRDEVEKLFNSQKDLILKLIPEADVQHVGSTAVPGSLTKGDLDIQVRVSLESFESASLALTQLYQINHGSDRNESFIAFKKDFIQISLGVQLSVINSPYDIFWKIRDFFLKHKDWNDDYNLLKESFEGKSMIEYRKAKSAFLEKMMDSQAFHQDFPQQ